MTQHPPTHMDAGKSAKPVQHTPSIDSEEARQTASLTTLHRRATTADVLRYQNVIGNRAVTRMFAPLPTLSQRMGYGIQRAFDFSSIKTPSLLEFAVLTFNQIESQDITPEEMNELKTERQRFMPLLGRFASAPETTLRIASAAQNITGDLAVTLLYAFSETGARFEYDGDRAKFQELIDHKAVKRFVVFVGLNRRLADQAPNPDTSPFNTNSMGAILQAITHELTVHAENMLDFIEDYWTYAKDEMGTPPAPLESSSAEHAAFKGEEITRYEYMSHRAKQLGGNVGEGFKNREVNDKFSAK
ncbi:MAG: hypothetical protein U0670_10220 [Anaerolineae bacterium]